MRKDSIIDLYELAVFPVAGRVVILWLYEFFDRSQIDADEVQQPSYGGCPAPVHPGNADNPGTGFTRDSFVSHGLLRSHVILLDLVVATRMPLHIAVKQNARP